MPHYVFTCLACQKEFTLVMHMEERESHQFRCPECGSEHIEPKTAAFFAVTAKKS